MPSLIAMLDPDGVLERRGHNRTARFTRVDAARDRQVLGFHVVELLHVLVVLRQGLPHFIRHGMELDARVEILGVFTEHHQIDPVMEIERIAGVSLAWTKIRLQI